MRCTLLSIGMLATMAITAFADISDIFEDTLGGESKGVLDTVVGNQIAGNVINTLPASIPPQPVPNQQYANYPQAIPASYPQAVPANYPQVVPASYRPVANNVAQGSPSSNIQYIPYPVAAPAKKDDDDDEEEEDEEEEDEDEEDEEEFDADDLVTRRRRR